MCTEYTEKVNKKGNKVVTLWSKDGVEDKKTLRVEDNGNGFTVKVYSWLSTEPDMYYNLDYGTAADISDALDLFDYR